MTTRHAAATHLPLYPCAACRTVEHVRFVSVTYSGAGYCSVVEAYVCAACGLFWEFRRTLP